MNRSEIKELVKQIEAYYPSFNLSKDQSEIWVKTLELYSKEDVMSKVEYLIRQNFDYPPRLNSITHNLLTIEQKYTMKNEPLVMCPLCKRCMGKTEFDNHYYRCLLENELIQKFRIQRGVDITRDDLKGYSLEELETQAEKMRNYKKIGEMKEELMKNIRSEYEKDI